LRELSVLDIHRCEIVSGNNIYLEGIKYTQ